MQTYVLQQRNFHIVRNDLRPKYTLLGIGYTKHCSSAFWIKQPVTKKNSLQNQCFLGQYRLTHKKLKCFHLTINGKARIEYSWKCCAGLLLASSLVFNVLSKCTQGNPFQGLRREKAKENQVYYNKATDSIARSFISLPFCVFSDKSFFSVRYTCICWKQWA